MKQLVDILLREKTLTDDLFKRLIEDCNQETLSYINNKAKDIAVAKFGNGIFIRGLIEVSNYCKNNCYYCGIRSGNPKVERYRLDKETILDCCKQGYDIGIRTFVMQGGEDRRFDDDFIADVVKEIRNRYPECAITLSLGERTKEAYQRFYDAGANRYLLRHETFNREHYHILHPKSMSLEYRLECLNNLKEIGFQTGTGIMVGTPQQTTEHIIQDIRFIERLKPQMIGIGPFLPHKDTPFGNEKSGRLELTLLLLSIFRIMHPDALIPSTTALATLDKRGRELGILAGANVVMPNLSPKQDRKKYALYNDKAALGAESVEGLILLEKQLNNIGYKISLERGDFVK